MNLKKEYGRLFRWFLNPTGQEFVNHHPHNQNLHSNVTDPKSKKHELPDCPNKQGAIKKLKKSPKSDDGKDSGNVKANISNISEDFADRNCLLTESHEEYDAAEDCGANIDTISFAEKYILFQQSL